jgi:hypothetical protein
MEKRLQLTIHPLTPDLWPAVEDLFGKGAQAMAVGACTGGSEVNTTNEVARKTVVDFARS